MKRADIILENIFSETGFDITDVVQKAFVKAAMKVIAWDAWSRGMNPETIPQEREWFEIWFDEDFNKQLFECNEYDLIEQDDPMDKFYLDYCEKCIQMTNHISNVCQKCGCIDKCFEEKEDIFPSENDTYLK